MNEKILNESMIANKNTKGEHALKRKGALEAKLHARCQTFNGKSHEHVQPKLRVSKVLSDTIMVRKCTLASTSDTTPLDYRGTGEVGIIL